MDIEQQLLQHLADFSAQGEDPLEARGSFMLPPDFPAFSGHFPGNPLLPAFLQVTMVRLIVQQALALSLAPLVSERIKFAGFVRPDEKVEVAARICPAAGHWQVEFTLAKGEEKVTSGSIQLIERQA